MKRWELLNSIEYLEASIYVIVRSTSTIREQRAELLEFMLKWKQEFLQLYTDELSLTIPPGRHLLETLLAKNISLLDFAPKMFMTLEEVEELIFGQTPITIQFANSIAAITGVDAEFWINLEKNYRDKLEKLQHDTQ